MHNLRNAKREINHLRIDRLAMALLFLFVLAEHAVGQTAPEMWGDLEPGQYPVGFRTIFTYDYSRPSVLYSDWDGKLYPTAQQPGRQMQINIWYPAKVSTTDQQLSFGHYIDLMARQTDFGPIDEDKRRFANEVFISKTNALGGNGTFTEEKLVTLRNLRTAAYNEPQRIAEKFPLVVFPNGGSPAFQSIMSEYFASHGFVVAAGALKGRYGLTEDISARGFETAVDDLGFIISEVLKTDFADPERICLIGNAITASQTVAYQARNARVDCVVSLDGGFLSQFDQRILRQTAFYDPQEVNKPIMAIHAPHPMIDPQNIDHLVYSRQFRFHFPQMSEFHFLNYGALDKIVPDIIGKPNGDVENGFRLAAIYCLKFFDAFLRGNKESENFLLTDPSQEVSQHITVDKTKEALPSPPNITIVKDRFLNQGIEYVQNVYKDLKEKNPTPFPYSFYSDLKDWLAYKKDPEFENRYQLFQLALDSYPDSALVNYYLAYFALETGRTELSRELNNRTLELLETDTSAELTPERKATMREYVLNDLKNLDGV